MNGYLIFVLALLVFNGLLGHTVDGVAKLEITLTKDGKTGKATVYTEITRD